MSVFYRLLVLSFIILFSLVSCREQLPIPKPPLYLQVDFPDHKYRVFSDHCPYKFELSKEYEVKEVVENEHSTCHKDIDLGFLNALINFSYIDMDQPLSNYVNYANDRIEEHKIKATGIESELIMESEKKVFGALFTLQGDVATPFQFYLTDSTAHFASGVVYFNSVPNYDSLSPSLDYLKEDILHLLQTFEWKNDLDKSTKN